MKRIQFTAVFAAFLCCAASCNRSQVSPADSNTPAVRPLSARETQTLQSTNNFAFNAFAKISASEPEKNIFISPLSISMAVAMAYNGADGTTKRGIAKALDFQNSSDEDINASFKSLGEMLTGIDKTVKFTPANSIWYRTGLAPQASFTETNRKYFNAEITGLDFGNAEAAKSAMNGWVKDKTNGKIPQIISQVRASDVMFLINAIHFKGTWTHQFDKNLTQNADFMAAGGNVSVQFMRLKDTRYRTHADAGHQLAELPYGNKQFSMVVIMPAENSTLNQLVAQLSITNLNGWLAKADSTKMGLYLPKFSFSYEKSLNETLAGLGMAEAFTDRADFSRLLQGFKAGDLAITEVKHKAFVEVNEEGTEAAAATSIGIGVTSVPTEIRFNRPFVFLIREKNSGAIVFIGKLANPKEVQ